MLTTTITIRSAVRRTFTFTFLTKPKDSLLTISRRNAPRTRKVGDGERSKKHFHTDKQAMLGQPASQFYMRHLAHAKQMPLSQFRVAETPRRRRQSQGTRIKPIFNVSTGAGGGVVTFFRTDEQAGQAAGR